MCADGRRTIDGAACTSLARSLGLFLVGETDGNAMGDEAVLLEATLGGIIGAVVVLMTVQPFRMGEGAASGAVETLDGLAAA